ncbi:MAG: single-stranded-DNA-specific exonuclease RecJ [Victivallaceae bacterium]|nr:single-stranded-DNA-specific exonuclease RecJ [Victivallaceae bacterium]
MGQKNWKLFAGENPEQIEQLSRNHSLPRAIAMYLCAHGIGADSITGYLEPKLSNLTDPYRFPRIEDAACRLWDAIDNHEPILIHGDYDTDGITASALLAWVLRTNGAVVHSFIPHRFDDGYGFTPESLDKALEAFGPCKVLVTVDCGITSVEAVKAAHEKGIDVIITDHHEAGPELPDAIAVINPKIYPELADLQLLAGAGTAFKLSHAFIKYGRIHNRGGFQTKLGEILDYVALGTVADIVPLCGENRIMVSYGLHALQSQKRPGVRALIDGSRIHAALSPSDITFRLAPRINAAGRVGDANIALKLLEAENITEAYRCADELERYNTDRQQKEQEIYQEAKEQIERGLAWKSDYSLLVAGRDWHQGVIGIVASRLTRDYNRPTIVLTIQGDVAYGSGRSIPNLNLVDVLSTQANLLERFGGHPMAVGVGLKTENIAQFFEGMDSEIRHRIGPSDLEDFISYDGNADLHEMDDYFFECLNKLAPFGLNNPKPVFRFNEVQVIYCTSVGANGAHTRGTLQCMGSKMDFIAFNRSPEQFHGKLLDVLATPQINHHINRDYRQLSIVDIKEVY